MAAKSPLQIVNDIDAEGRPVDVESEDLGDLILEPFDPRLIDVSTETRSLDVLVRRVEADQIDLDPDFQRSRGIWSDKKKSLLIESLLLRIPLPTFYVAELVGDEELGASRWSVVDGIQRLSTIVQFVNPSALGLEPLALTSLEYLSSEEGKTYDSLPVALQLRLLESQLTMQVIRRSTPDAVKLNIFARINTGGVPLSAQELRHALTPGPARDVLKNFAASRAFQLAVDGSVSQSRMADREMVLRYLAFLESDPLEYRSADFDHFLREAMRTVNDWSETTVLARSVEFDAVMTLSRRIFLNDAFRKRYSDEDGRKPVSKALFEVVSVTLAKALRERPLDFADRVLANKEGVRRGFIDLMNDREFEKSISQSTGDPKQVRMRFAKMQEMFAKAVS